MNRNNLIIMVIILIFVSVFVVLSKLAKPEANWNSYFDLKGKNPHDIGLTFHLLEDIDKNQKIEIVKLPFYDYKRRKLNGQSLIVRMDFEMDLDSHEIVSLLDFTAEGNELFLSGTYFDAGFIKKVFDSKNPEIICMMEENHVYYDSVQQSTQFFSEDSTIFSTGTPIIDSVLTDEADVLDTFNDEEPIYEFIGDYEYMPDPFFTIIDSCIQPGFMHNKVSYNYCNVKEFKNKSTRYNYFIEEIQDYFTDEIQSRGYVNDLEKLNFIEIKWGDGKIFLHSQPQLFTNWFVKDTTGFNYLKTAFSYTQNRNIIWYDNFIHPDDYDDDYSEIKSPLKYLFSHDSLIWAWYLMLISAILFVIFYAKRRLRIMPLLPLNQNTSIEFASSVGLMYFNEEKYSDTAMILVKNLHQYIIDKYGIKYRKDDKLFFAKLSKFSSYSDEEIHKFFQAIDFKALNIYHSSDQVMNIYKRIENFKKSLK